MAGNVLLAIDLNMPEAGLRPLEEAMKVLSPDGTLHILAVVPTFGMPQVSGFFREGHEKEALHTAGEQLKNWVNSHVPPAVDVHPHVTHGTVYDEILRAAERLSADLIVMGAHRPEFADYLLGPNASRVVRHAKQSVFVVRN